LNDSLSHKFPFDLLDLVSLTTTTAHTSDGLVRQAPMKLKGSFPRTNYSSIESGSSSSSEEDEPAPTSPLRTYSLYRQYSKRLFKDSTSNLKGLESSLPILNHQQLQDYDENDPKYVERIKIEFFGLGFVIGAAIQMLSVSIILMFVSYSQHSGPLLELSHEYYPVFRCMFFISFFFTLYGANLFLWRRVKIEYRSVLGVGSTHTYRMLCSLLHPSHTHSLCLTLCLSPSPHLSSLRVCSSWRSVISRGDVHLLHALCPHHHRWIGKLSNR
jgi:hypothetical protein